MKFTNVYLFTFFFQNKSSLFSMLPPPKSQTLTKVSKPLIPQVLSRKPPAPKPQTIKPKPQTKPSSLLGANYDSDSDDETTPKVAAKSSSKLDFFSLSSSEDKISNNELAKIQKETEEMTAKFLSQRNSASKQSEQGKNVPMEVDLPGPSSTTTLGLPKEEIILKNNVEVGPKLPVPEQEFNVDSRGNVAFDEKAMQYLCGKRGVKRKNVELESANIIEINGEDIKPDEREWLVKALTEEPIHRPVSLGSGPGGQSKRKHQITYLAHQAKAMELELQNQWSQSRQSRKQTQSKYGF